MKKTITPIKILLISMMFFWLGAAAQNDKVSVASSNNRSHSLKLPGNRMSAKSASTCPCAADAWISNFLDSNGNPFNGFLCDGTDSVSGTFANGVPFYNSDAYFIRLSAGSQVKFYIDNCLGTPSSLTVCDSLGNPISGAYSPSTCPNTLNFTATYTGDYYIVMNLNGIAGGPAVQGIGDVYCVRQPGTTLPVCNDLSCNATPLVVNGAFESADNSIANVSDHDDTLAVNAGYSCYVPNNTMWYSYTPASTTTEYVQVAFTSPVGGLQAWMGMFSTTNLCVDPLTYIDCVVGPQASGDTMFTNVTCVPGNTYLFMVDGVAGAVGSFSIGLFASTPPPPTPVNDTICGAINLILNDPPVSGNTTAAAYTDPRDADVIAAGYSCSTPNNTLWYSYTPAVADSFDLVITDDGLGFASWVSVYSVPVGASSCTGTLTDIDLSNFGCFNGTNVSPNGGAISIRVSMDPANTYYILMDGVSGAVGAFTIGINSMNVGLNEFEQNIRGLDIFPNPANDELNVKYRFHDTRNVTVELLDLAGRVVFTQQLDNTKSGESMIDVKNFSNGLYMLKLSSNDGSSTRKVMVQH